MSHLEIDIKASIARIGRGVWFSQSVIARRSDCTVKTARRHLDRMTSEGLLIMEYGQYRPNVRQPLWMIKEE